MYTCMHLIIVKRRGHIFERVQAGVHEKVWWEEREGEIDVIIVQPQK